MHWDFPALKGFSGPLASKEKDTIFDKLRIARKTQFEMNFFYGIGEWKLRPVNQFIETVLVSNLTPVCMSEVFQKSLVDLNILLLKISATLKSWVNSWSHWEFPREPEIRSVKAILALIQSSKI